MDRSNKFVLWTVMTVAAMLLTAFCICGTVSGQGRGQRRIDERYYRSMEQEYKKEICRLLEAEGYRNSGVTINYITAKDGVRNYTVTIHHRRIEKLDEESRQELISRCKEVPFPVSGCLFFHEFLETDL